MTKELLSRGEKRLVNFINISLLLLVFVTVYPFLYIVSASFSSGNALTRGAVFLFPVDFTLGAYQALLSEAPFWASIANSVFYLFTGTLFCMVISTIGAYALSKPYLVGRKYFNIFIAFTMWFSAGMIPKYLNLQSLGLLDSRTGIIIGLGMNAFNIIILRNAFENVPKEMEESAFIDGASDFQIFRYIYLPLVKPTLATVGLFYAIARWNSWFWESILLRNTSLIPVQVYLRKIISQTNSDELANIVELARDAGTPSPETITYAVMVVSIIPMLIIYPFIQKYFTKGVTLGGVKG